MINIVTKFCACCGKEYQCHFNDRDRSKYCSRECLGKHAPKRSVARFPIPCGHCKKEMLLSKGRIAQNKLGIVYCSHGCKKEAMKLGKAGYGFKPIDKDLVYKKYYPYRVKTINGVRIKEHRWVMEQHLARKLKSHEFIHHINGDTHDNRLENLMLVDNVSHGKIEFASVDRLHH